MTQTVKKTLELGEQTLTEAGIYSPLTEMERIVAHVLGMPRESLVRHGASILSETETRMVEAILARRAQREPFVRIIGEMPFLNVVLQIEPGVFEPMTESESLVEHGVKRLEGIAAPRVLDIGTGCGAMLLALLKEVPDATGVGVDIDPTALHSAARNAEYNELQDRVQFQEGDLATDINEKFDLVMANVPFVPSQLIPQLMPEVRVYNPETALDGGKDGMQLVRRLVRQLPHVMKPDGIALMQTSLKALPIQKQALIHAGFEKPEPCLNYYGVPVALAVTGKPTKTGVLGFLQRLFA